MIKKLFFIYAAMLLIAPKPCLSMQKENFEKFKELLRQDKIASISTSQSINKLLWEATYFGNYALVEKIVTIMKDLDLIEQYAQLYQAIRDKEKGVEALHDLLKKNVNPNGYALHNNTNDTQPNNALTLAKNQYKLANDEKSAWWSRAPGLKKDYKIIYELLEQAGFEEGPPLQLACEINNQAAIHLLLSYGAYDYFRRSRL